MKTSEVLINFFKHTYHNCQRIASWYNTNMEVQINVAACGGVQEKLGVFSSPKESYKWYNVRIPENAKSDPIDNDKKLSYPLDKYIDFIGMTGWDWKNKKSVRFGFDFDDITGHAPGVGITPEEMEHVKERAFEIPELLILRSTSGSGLHLYLECDPNNLPTTNTHTEHAALAIAALQELSQRVKFDFNTHLDVGGGNMWVWSRKMTKENKGLTILKENTKYYIPPKNWTDYLEVAKGKRKKSRLKGVNEEDQKIIDKESISQVKIDLNDEHNRLITDLHEICPEASTFWVPDRNLLQTHTVALKQVFNTKTYKGIFDTISNGDNLIKPNCFGYPQADGSWKFIRFGQGTNEVASWRTSEEGWTYCYFNKLSSLKFTSNFFKGVEDDKQGFVFSSLENALKAAKAIGSEIEIPEALQDREITFKTHVDGRLLVEIIKYPSLDDDLKIQGWLKKRNIWYKIFDTQIDSLETNLDLSVIDKYIRSKITPQHEMDNWAVKHAHGFWMSTKKDDARTTLAATPLSKTINSALALALQNSWTVVNLPFQPEYPGSRKWNLLGAQFKYEPADLRDNEEPYHPHWDKILENCGQDLTPYLKDLPWAIENNILTGKDYLLSWIVHMYRTPFKQLPYLFFWGPQNSGKSTIHEALELLISKGVVQADTALTSPQGFNGELAGAILCVVEEKNVSRFPEAYARIKGYITGKKISVHAKHKQVYEDKNTTHWMHMANEQENCPIFPGDTRIVSMHVPQLANPIDEEVFKEKLIEEAPHFMVTLKRFKLPEITGRLRLPLISTSSKLQQEEANRDPLENFLNDNCFYVPGEKIPFKDFYSKFIQNLTELEKCEWSKKKIISSLKPNQPFGQSEQNIKYIGNISFEPPKSDEEPIKHYIRQGDQIILVPIK